MNPDITYKQAVKNAKALKQIGQTSIYLFSEADVPWEHVVKVEPGSSHRLEIATSARFEAKHPCGLTFTWSIDIEESEANGRGYYMITPEKCREVMERLPASAQKQFRAYLEDCAAKVTAKAKEWREITERQERDGKTLAALAAV